LRGVDNGFTQRVTRAPKPKESIMKLKNLLLATLAGTAAILSAPVFADGRDHDREHDRGWHGERRGWHDEQRAYYPQHRYYYAPPRVVYGPPPVVYAPPAYYGYAPAPSYYYPAPAPVYQPPMPVSPDISIRFRLPL
jgi:hypothetical protein